MKSNIVLSLGNIKFTEALIPIHVNKMFNQNWWFEGLHHGQYDKISLIRTVGALPPKVGPTNDQNFLKIHPTCTQKKRVPQQTEHC